MDTAEDVEINPTKFSFWTIRSTKISIEKESISGTIIYIDEKRKLFYVKEFFFSQ